MAGKTVLYIAVALCMAAFTPSTHYAHAEYSHSDKEHKSKSLWNRLTGSDHEKESYGNGHEKDCNHGKKRGHGKDCGHGKKEWGKKGKSGMYAFWWRSSSMAERLRLDAEQIAALDEISDSYQTRMREAGDKMREAKWEFSTLMKDPQSSPEAIKSAAESMYKARTEKERMKLEKKLAMREILRPEQIEDISVLKRKGHKGCDLKWRK